MGAPPVEDDAVLPARRAQLAFPHVGLPRNMFHKRVKRYLEIAEANGAQKEAIRELSRESLFFFLVYVLGWTFLDNDFAYDFSHAVAQYKYEHIWIMAREHYKSTIITIGSTVREMLFRPDLTYVVYSYNLTSGQELFFKPIKTILESNQTIKSVWPDVVWQDGEKADVWQADQLNLKRPAPRKEHTLECASILKQKTGYHFDRGIYDDCVTPESVVTAEMIGKVIGQWRMSLNTLARGAKKCVIGTFYHYAELYSTIISEHLLLPVIQRCVDPNGVPVLMTIGELQKRKKEMGSAVFASQMMCDPKQASTQAFRPEWVQRWAANIWEGLNVYIFVDPAGKVSRKRDYTVMWAVAVDHNENYFILDIIRDKLNLKGREDALFSLYAKYKPAMVFYETVGQQSDVEHMREAMDYRKYHFAIQEVGEWEEKGVRIERLIPLLERRCIWFPVECVHKNFEGMAEDMLSSFFTQEYNLYPFCAHDDGLDSLSFLRHPQVKLHAPDVQTQEEIVVEKMRRRGFATVPSTASYDSNAF